MGTSSAERPPKHASGPDANIARWLRRMADENGEARAVSEARRSFNAYTYRHWSFAELERDSSHLASAMVAMGIGRGQRIALMVRPSFNFVSLTFALFKTRATLVLIDPGMGRKHLINCLEAVDLDGFVAIPIVHLVRRWYSGRFPNATRNVVVGRLWPGQSITIEQMRRQRLEALPPESSSSDDSAAIIFTTGSTGPPKGVHFTHGNFDAQVRQIQQRFEIEAGGVDVAGFPLFGLFNGAMGVTTVIPDMDATRPASVNPASYVKHIQDMQATQSFASPAVWNTVGRYCESRGAKMPSLQKVLSAGAPVPPHVLRWVTDHMHPDGEMHTPYGATEALPIASIPASEVLEETAAMSAVGKGTCVGRRFSEVEWKVIAINDQPIADIADVKELPHGEIGELIVRGPQVTAEYVTRTEANALHKIRDGATIWHRMGDVGYFDRQERFWFCGRKAHRVQIGATQTMFTVPCEAIFNQHPEIYRSALVGVGQVGASGEATPVMICEPWKEQWPKNRQERQRLIAELAELGAASPKTLAIEPHHVLLKRALPVDIRHNAKIFREQLAVWAAKKLAAPK